MFTDNALQASNITNEQKENTYYILYYHFIKHAFGLSKVWFSEKVYLRVFFDNLPQTNEKSCEFKNFIYNLRRIFLQSNILLLKENIAEVDSKKHVIVQCVDIILGSMAFRLNKHHRYIEPGKKRRGKRTRAKEEVYKYINKRIQELYPDSAFNIGTSTGHKSFNLPHWSMPYRHWIFKSRTSRYDASKKIRPRTSYINTPSGT